uniref:Metalloendopeptidase n=1 Tax=Glossina brevipalpis TaxID=37001 RepID=A0A1A9WUH0_9MUSC
MRTYGVFLISLLIGLSCSLPVDKDPELTAGYVEGDMILTSRQRNGLRDEVWRWPNNTVYYKFFTVFDEDHHNYILRGMEIIEEISCIRFKEATTSDIQNYVNITGFDGGCYSEVGWLNEGAQTYNLQIYALDSGCFRLGTIVHEFLHTLGFFHMQSAANRDDYVRIAEENIDPKNLHNFNKYDETEVDDFNQEYDYGSVLHYGPTAFSINGEKTIIPIYEDEAAGNMGQRRGMSEKDINKLNLMYRCPLEV